MEAFCRGSGRALAEFEFVSISPNTDRLFCDALSARELELEALDGKLAGLEYICRSSTPIPESFPFLVLIKFSTSESVSSFPEEWPLSVRGIGGKLVTDRGCVELRGLVESRMPSFARSGDVDFGRRAAILYVLYSGEPDFLIVSTAGKFLEDLLKVYLLN